MSVLRVIALGIGWIVMLAGTLACIASGMFAVAVTAGATFGPEWTGTAIVAAAGGALMIGALPLMFFGCEARQDIRANRAAAPCGLLRDVVNPAPHAMPEMALAGTSNHLSSFAVRTLVHRR